MYWADQCARRHARHRGLHGMREQTWACLWGASGRQLITPQMQDVKQEELHTSTEPTWCPWAATRPCRILIRAKRYLTRQSWVREWPSGWHPSYVLAPLWGAKCPHLPGAEAVPSNPAFRWHETWRQEFGTASGTERTCWRAAMSTLAVCTSQWTQVSKQGKAWRWTEAISLRSFFFLSLMIPPSNTFW